MNNVIPSFGRDPALPFVPTPHVYGTGGGVLAPQPPKQQTEGRNLTQTQYMTNADDVGRLDRLDMDRSLSKAAYDVVWPRLKIRLHRALTNHLAARRGLVVIVEGWDAGGKTGAIKRLFSGFDDTQIKLCHTVAPTKLERMHHFLWRFQQLDPRQGKVLVFDRSWYGRVLVERVERSGSVKECQDAYADINEYEAQLSADRIDVVKFWLHIDFQEQKHRLQKRLFSSDKTDKLNDDDFRNYCFRVPYCEAAEDMFLRTGRDDAPWFVVPGNDKRFARARIARLLTEFLRARQM